MPLEGCLFVCVCVCACACVCVKRGFSLFAVSTELFVSFSLRCNKFLRCREALCLFITHARIPQTVDIRRTQEEGCSVCITSEQCSPTCLCVAVVVVVVTKASCQIEMLLAHH